MTERTRTSRGSRTRSVNAVRAASIGVALTVLVTACTGGGGRPGANVPTGPRINGGTATMALSPSNSPNYILPFNDSAHFTNANIQRLQYLLFRPLYWFGNGSAPTINYKLSLAKQPTYSSDGRTVTVGLNNYEWADGTTLTSKDVAFWHALAVANKDSWGGYVPGAYPDNITSIETPDASTVVFHLDKAYDQRWFLYNCLSLITPLPQHAWDKTSDSGPVGNAAKSASSAVAVYKYLDAQSRQLSTYTTNKLWQVVSGPWKLSEFDSSTGTSSFVPNKNYSGPIKPSLDKFTELGFTSDQAQLNQVASGGVDLGYLPFNAIPQENRFRSQGYQVADWQGWSVRFFVPNYNSPDNGAVFKQLYVRQALQRVMDQRGVVKAAYGGRAKENYGPIPSGIESPFLSEYAKTNPYPFDTDAAKSLLTSHGWKIEDGVAVCRDAGSGSSQCGSGIASGKKLELDLIYASGDSALEQNMSIYKSNAAKAGISIGLSTQPFGSVVGSHGKCTPGTARCNWDMINWGGGWGYAPDYYPTGDVLFATGAGSNRSNYSDKQNDANIAATQLAGGDSTANLTKYQNYLIQQAAVIWSPVPPFQISLIKSTLHGVTPQASVLNITPEQWYLTKER